tara:strand:+ start:758 stop:1750 length:993 start_codon:yes stop_codon:yes gene_type:complete
MAYKKSNNPVQRRRRRRKRAKHLLDTPTIEVSKTTTPNNPLNEKVIATTGKTGLGSDMKTMDYDFNPYFKDQGTPGKIGIMGNNRTNIKLNVPLGNLRTSKDRTGTRPVNLTSNLTVAPNSLLRSKPEYTQGNNLQFNSQTGSLEKAMVLTPGTGQFNKKVTGFNANVGFSKNIGAMRMPTMGNTKDQALNSQFNIEGGLNFNNLSNRAVKPYAKVNLKTGVNTDKIRKIANSKIGDKFSLGLNAELGLGTTFFNKSKTSKVKPEHLDGSPNSFQNLSFGAKLTHKKTGVSLGYSRSKNHNISNNMTSSGKTNRDNKISLNIPLSKISRR